MSLNKFSYLPLSPEEEEEFGHDIIYAASFKRNANTYMFYASLAYMLICIPLILAYGIGLILLLWSPVLWYLNYMDITTRKLFVTSDSIIYITSPPACIPCLGVNKTEKHCLLALVTDVVVSQSWYAGCFGLDVVQIENAGQGGMAGQKGKTPDLTFGGIEDAQTFKKIVLRAAAAKRAGQSLTRDSIESMLTTGAEALSMSSPQNTAAFMYGNFPSPSNNQALQPTSNFDITKLDQLNGTMSRIEQLLARQVNNNVSV